MKTHSRAMYIGTAAERSDVTPDNDGDLYLETGQRRISVWMGSAWHSLVEVSAIDNVSNPPTAAELTAIFGDPGTLPTGFRVVLDDAGARATVYEIVVVGRKWFGTQLTGL